MKGRQFLKSKKSGTIYTLVDQKESLWKGKTYFYTPKYRPKPEDELLISVTDSTWHYAFSELTSKDQEPTQ